MPLYLVIQRAGLLDTRLALVVTYLTFTLPFTIWLLKSYFQGIPRELEEAALVDGCGFWRMMGRVLLPAAAPASSASMSEFRRVATTCRVIQQIDEDRPARIRDGRNRVSLAARSAVGSRHRARVLFQRLIVQGLSGAVKG